jgi:transcriptional regulator with XRE-family HTH domain
MDLGLLQREVAARIGSDNSSVWLWEKDRGMPELRFVPAVLAFLGYDPRPVPRGIGERLVRYREGLGWSQKRLAKELNVNPTTLSRWESGRKVPSGDYVGRTEKLLAS